MTKHTILFTGHMIDAAGRKQPRFPAEKEPAAREKIKQALLQEKEKRNGLLQGIGSAACGGDILFQELCRELNIPSEIYLALPPEAFKESSVSFAGKQWAERFDNLLQQFPVHILPEKAEQNVWVATNEWMLREAMKGGGPHMTLIALWNGQGGDGPGGTQHMVDVAKASEAEVIIIPAQDL